jgi:hypothetical protein
MATQAHHPGSGIYRPQPGWLQWTVVRNLVEDKSHAHGFGKQRIAIVLAGADAATGRVPIAGTTTNPMFRDGTPRARIPSRLWEDRYPQDLWRNGYFWGGRTAWIDASDFYDPIGPLTLELLGLADKTTTIADSVLSEACWHTVTAERQAVDMGEFVSGTVRTADAHGVIITLDDDRTGWIGPSDITDLGPCPSPEYIFTPGERVHARIIQDGGHLVRLSTASGVLTAP